MLGVRSASIYYLVNATFTGGGIQGHKLDLACTENYGIHFSAHLDQTQRNQCSIQARLGLSQHVRRQHSNVYAAAVEEDEQGIAIDASELETEEAGTIRILAVDLKRNDALLLLKMKYINRVSQNALDDIVGDVIKLFQARLLQLKEDLLTELGPESITAMIDSVAKPLRD